jgi:hypothetical protein
VDEALLTDTAKLLWRLYGEVLLGVPELARIFRYGSKASVHNALHKGRIKGLRIIRIGRRIFADFRDVADFLDEHRGTDQEELKQ